MSTATNPGIFPLPGDVGALYSISSAEWEAINQRAAVVVESKAIAAEVVQYIPSYPTLLPTCVEWQSQTYQSLIAQAVLVGTFATSMLEALSQIRKSVDASADADPLDAGQKFLIRVKFEAIADQAGTVDTGVVALTPDVQAFVSENQKADASLQQIASSLPTGWGAIVGPIGRLSDGFAAVQHGWSGLATQLQALSRGQADSSTAGQVRAAVDAAVPAWTALCQSAVAFDSQATNPTT